MFNHIEAQIQTHFLSAVLGYGATAKNHGYGLNQGAQVLQTGLPPFGLHPIGLHPDAMQAYAGNLAASVTRALGTVYPTVYSLLGANDFDPLAQLYLAQHPPRCGDWAQYGAQFPSWLTQHNPGGVTDALPYLPDIARMDYAIFGCENSANQTVDRDSLALLTHDANTLRLVVQAHVKQVGSIYDIYSIVQGQAQSRNLTSQTPQTVCVWRDGWRAQIQKLSPDQHLFLNACIAGQTLAHAHALALAVNPGFDFAAWLVQALNQNLILHIERTPHGQDTDHH